MRLIVLRHGKAEPRSASGLDADRALVAKGRQQAAFVGAALVKRGLGPDLILTSPIRRAIETARIVHAALAESGFESPFEVSRRLETDRPVGDALGAIAERADAATLLLVGHNPQLEMLVDRSVGGAIPGGVEILRTGQAVLLEVMDPAHVVQGAQWVDAVRLDGE